MAEFELSLDQRRRLWGSGFGAVDAALRFAAVELDLWFLTGVRLHWGAMSDGEHRHFANSLTWANAALGGVNKGIKRSGDVHLMSRWKQLGDGSRRPLMRELRNDALKDGHDAAPWAVEVHDDSIRMYRRLRLAEQDVEPYGAAQEFLRWIRDEALVLLDSAIEKGARGDIQIDTELPLREQMPFSDDDPWTTRSDPEVARLADENLVAISQVES